jgi:hypothetical protein
LVNVAAAKLACQRIELQSFIDGLGRLLMLLPGIPMFAAKFGSKSMNCERVLARMNEMAPVLGTELVHDPSTRLKKHVLPLKFVRVAASQPVSSRQFVTYKSGSLYCVC